MTTASNSVGEGTVNGALPPRNSPHGGPVTWTPAWVLGWTDTDLAERGVPCICGHEPDAHEEIGEQLCVDGCRGGDHPDCGEWIGWVCRECDNPADTDGSCTGWIPDRERLCDTCRGAGYPPATDDQDVYGCRDCDGRGWTQ